MPNQIENFLLGLKFDNEQFERGAAQSISTLDKLKDALSLKGAESGASNLQKAFSNLSFNSITNGLNNVTKGFSALEQIGIGALRNLGAQIESLGVSLVKKVGLDQIYTGWGKYKEITQSVQTIIAATGKGIEEVTKYTDILNWFTDETSFSLTDMTNNIAKFTSAGIDLDKAVNQMMGIGNAAALAGAGVQGASHAMSGFSKAMAAGYMSTINWSWIQTAKLDTLAFKQALIDAAVEVGTLKKVGNAFYTVSKGTKVSAENMREGLSEKWLNTAAMEKALNVYGEFSSKLNEFYQMVGNGSYYTTSNLLEFIEQYNDSTVSAEQKTEMLDKIYKQTGVSVEDLAKQLQILGSSTYSIGRKAFAAAQEAITLRQAWDALTDAVSTGWMKTFQLIFGNYEEAKKLWTNLANTLYELFAEGGNTRNELLEDWHFQSSGGYQDFFDGLNNLMEGVVNFRDLIKETFSNLLPDVNVGTLTRLTTNFKQFTETFKNIPIYLSNLSKLKEALGITEEETVEIPEESYDHLSKYRELTGWVSPSERFHSRARNKILPDLPEEVSETLFEIPGVFTSVKNNLPKLAEEITESLFEIPGYYPNKKKNLPTLPEPMLNTVWESGESENADKTIRRFENLSDVLHGVYSAINIAKNALELFWGSFKTMLSPFKTLGDDFLELFGAIGRRIQDISLKLVGEGKMVRFFRDLGTSGGTIIEKLVNSIHKFVVALTELIDPEVESSASNFLGTIMEIFAALWEGIKTIVNTFAPMVSSLVSLLTELFGGLAGIFKDFFGEGVNFNNFTNRLKSLLDVGILAGIFGVFKKFNETLKKFKGKGVGDIISELINGSGGKSDDGLGIKGFLKNISSTFTEFTSSISKSLAKFTDSNLLKEFANSILKIAAAMLIIALIPEDKFARAAVTIASLVAAVVGMFYIFSKLDLKQSASVAAIGTAMAGIGTGLLMISAAMLVIALIPANKIDQGLRVLTVSLTELTAVLWVLSEMSAKRMLAASASILIMAAAVDLLSVGLAVMSLIPAKSVDKVFKVLTVALIEMTGVLTILSEMNPGNMIAAAASIMVIAAAMDVLALGIIALSLIPGDKLGGGVTAIALTIGAIATALGILANSTNGLDLIATAAALLIVAPALLIFSAALAVLALLPFTALSNGLLILGVGLAEIVLAAYLVTPVIPGLLALAGAFVAIGAGAVLLGAGLLGISVAVGLVVGIVTGGILLIIDALSNFVSLFTGTIQETSDQAAEGGEEMTNSLLTGLTDSFNVSIGDIVSNLVNGLVSNFSFSNIVEKIKGIGRRIWNWLKGGLESSAGIASPSKEMAKEMGYMIAGLGVGFEKNERSITDIGSNMAQTLLDASDATFDGYEPSLTPVLDMSQASPGSLSFGATLTPGAARNLATVSADIRDQRESMNDYIDQAVSSAINGMRDQLTFIVPLEVDGRQFAQSTAKFTRSELNLIDRNNLRKGGLA